MLRVQVSSGEFLKRLRAHLAVDTDVESNNASGKEEAVEGEEAVSKKNPLSPLLDVIAQPGYFTNAPPAWERDAMLQGLHTLAALDPASLPGEAAAVVPRTKALLEGLAELDAKEVLRAAFRFLHETEC